MRSAGASSVGSVDDAVGLTQETVKRLEQVAGDLVDAAEQAGAGEPTQGASEQA